MTVNRQRAQQLHLASGGLVDEHIEERFGVAAGFRNRLRHVVALELHGPGQRIERGARVLVQEAAQQIQVAAGRIRESKRASAFDFESVLDRQHART